MGNDTTKERLAIQGYVDETVTVIQTVGQRHREDYKSGRQRIFKPSLPLCKDHKKRYG